MTTRLEAWTVAGTLPAKVGVVERAEPAWRFTYEPTWLDRADRFALSLSLPLETHPHEGPSVRRWFSNLLPEGQARRAVSSRLGVSEDNDWALLVALGGDCAGALSLLPEPSDGSAENRRSAEPPNPEDWAYEPMGDDKLHRLLHREVVPLLVSGTTVRLSLAGAQDKVPVAVLDGVLHLPLGSAPSTHILKLPNRDFAHLPVNEAFVTELARAAGLPAVHSELLLTEPAALLVERFDRHPSSNPWPVTGLHQEDLCQALGLPPGQKYESEGGPSLADAIGTVRRASIRPLEDVAALIAWAAFHAAAGNADAHGKNLALVQTTAGTRLAPFYDLVSTRAYPQLDRKLAMGIGGHADMDTLRRTHWQAASRDMRLGPKVVLRLVEETIAKVLDALKPTVRIFRDRYGGQPVLETLPRAIERRCRAVLRGLSPSPNT